VYLVDTSAWIEVFRKGTRITVDDLVDDRDAIVTCLPVIQDVLQGFDDERAFQIARTAMLALPCVEAPMTLALTERAVDIYRRTRRIGLTVRSSVDCLIAACAERHHLTVVHRDRDFAAVAKAVALEHIDIAARQRR
jgi:predicted nucleic acid-binding protein